MSSSNKVWRPMGLEPGLQRALSVPAQSRQMTPDLYRELLVDKLNALIQENPQAARNALEASPDNAPMMMEIAEMYAPKDWAYQIVHSDQMQMLLSDVDWKGMRGEAEPVSLLEILEQLP